MTFKALRMRTFAPYAPLPPAAGPRGGALVRLCAWIDMLVVDHGVLRLLYCNKHRVTKDLWRAGQPTPRQLAWFAARGVRTVVSLRAGREHGAWVLEKQACERLGLHLTELAVFSREAPDPETIRAAKRLFETIEYPAVIHCKSGADRTGLAAALYLILREGRSTEQAIKQLSMRYGHFKFTRTGILDRFFDLYRAQGEPQGLSLPEWAETVYDKRALSRA